MKVATSALRLLYLEDNPVDADLTRRALARLAPQMRMEVVATLAAALELLTQADPPFDLVLADLNLPDGSGLDLLGHVRAHQLPLAVVILTGSGDQEAAVTALKAGADDYLVKRPEQFENLPRVLLAAFTSFQKNSDRCSKPLRVLYGDPNGYDVDLTFRYLTQHAPHIRMKSVGSGEEVLACLPPEGGALPAFDVLLLDYRLPCMNALQVVKVVRQERGLDLPIVLVTGHGTEDVAVRALRLGVDDYLVKHQGYLQKLPAVLEKAQRLAELNASEERYRALFEHNHAVMLVVDPESGEVVDANQSAATWYGWPRVELCRKNICEISTSPWHETLGEIELARIRRDWRFLRRHRKADGSLRDVEVLGGPITVAGRSLLYGIILDITDKHRAQQDLKKRESEFQHLSQEFNGLLDAIPDDLMLLDRDLKVLWANRAAAESIDVPAGELKGRSCYELFCNRTAPCTLCPPLQSFTSGTPHEETVTRIDGRTWDIRSVPLLDEQGRVEKVIELRRDISEQKALELQYLHAQKMESIGTLTGGIAHDFNNILTAIVGFASLLSLRLGPEYPFISHVDNILTCSERAANLIKSLLTFSRKQAFELKEVDLSDFVAREQKMLARLIREDISLTVSTTGYPLPVMIDQGQCLQILMNLTVNALDAMPQGGKVMISTAPLTLDREFVSANGFGTPGKYAMIAFSDTGCGMDEVTRQRVYEPFFTTKEVGKGTGLGLATVYGIVKQHNGFMSCYSELGIGTTFKIYLPLLPGLAEREPEAMPLTPVGGTETILLAEDDEMVMELVSSVLQQFGYRVLKAVNGSEALEKFKEQPDDIQLAILDVIMPRKNGRQVYQEMLGLKPGTRAIFTSGYPAKVFRDNELLDETVAFVSKPVSPNELLSKIREVLDAP